MQQIYYEYEFLRFIIVIITLINETFFQLKVIQGTL